MIVFEDDVSIRFAGSEDNAAFVKINAVGGVNNENNKKVAKAITEWFVSHGIAANRIYLVFSDKNPENWSTNGLLVSYLIANK
ncbi:macrophage migration inhibitory factor-like protein, putative [Trichomonas vaginalis G3]|uniref:L-dopachrome isomerase n=1 Tax=Trichomonas vaginalis (strain ATCC PRA-98 / G3) TaxID=412133 RepID=A2FSL9_TRIV3|nr:tautomerase/mif family [Trichomonas vaginalis G3]EAX92096.1 macrophage migration inhibitory factor-like protein, putative [Trichomonas vaginalis G3]KAI5508924.1 tautomerase/mif family [Trichomonas vaginalis G3]|eukprot:XP_001305026.1 macrophage migration inhibitory factor-like protein [Trichomonas vaginalis G3]